MCPPGRAEEGEFRNVVQRLSAGWVENPGCSGPSGAGSGGFSVQTDKVRARSGAKTPPRAAALRRGRGQAFRPCRTLLQVNSSTPAQMNRKHTSLAGVSVSWNANTDSSMEVVGQMNWRKATREKGSSLTP